MKNKQAKVINSAMKHSIGFGETVIVGGTQYRGKSPYYAKISEGDNGQFVLVKGVPYVNMDKLSKNTVQSENTVKVQDSAPV